MNRQTASTFKPLAAALLAALGIVPLATQAATIVVFNGGDTTATTISCTLRQAIVSMNAGAVTGTGCKNTGGAFHSNDTINFNTLEFPSSGPITLANGNGQLSITDANLTIDATANGNVTIDAAGNSRVMYDAVASGSLTLNHLTLVNGRSTFTYPGSSNRFNDHGGGIFIAYANLTLSDSTVSGNGAWYRGGGICALFGSVTLTNSTVSGNFVQLLYAAQGDAFGGGISSGFGSVTLTNSTVSGNSAYVPGGSFAAGGGGIYTKGASVTLTNSTLSGNSTKNGSGGGIFTISGHIALTNSTVSVNSAGLPGGGGIYMSTSGTLVANNSIVAGNSDSPGPNSHPDIRGPSPSGANNLIGGNPMLGALANNGGPTWTMMPQAGSPALSGVPCLAGIGTDQRGYIRPDPPGTPCDIGAVEVGSILDEIFKNGFEP